MGGGRDRPIALVAPLEIGVGHSPASALGDSVERFSVNAERRMFRVESWWYATSSGDAAEAPSVGARARLITAARAEAPTLASARLTRDARIVEHRELDPTTQPTAAKDASARQRIAETVAVGVSGTSLILSHPPRDDPDAEGVELRLHFTDRPGTFALSMVLRRMVAPGPLRADDDEEDDRQTPPPVVASMPHVKVMQRETALIDDLAADEDGSLRLSVLIPWNFEMTDDAARRDRRSVVPDTLRVDLAIAPVGDPAPPDIALRAAQAMENLARSISSDPGVVPPPASARSARALIDSMGELVEKPHDQRRALAFLSAELGAPLMSDVALVADESTLARVVTSLSEQARVISAQATAAQWGLALELIALRVLGEMQSAGNLPAELRSALLRHTGEAGRTSSGIEELLSSGPVASRADLERRLIAENLIALEDPSPGTRVRAQDWLASRGQAPEGFDPLGPPAERRAALERLLAGPATQPEGP